MLRKTYISLNRRAPSLLVILSSVLILALYGGLGLICALGLPSRIPEMSATEAFCTFASILCVVIYLIKLVALPAKSEKTSKGKAVSRVPIVLFIVGYTCIYFLIDWFLGIKNLFAALGSVCTIVGLTTVFLDYIYDELCFIRASDSTDNTQDANS